MSRGLPGALLAMALAGCGGAGGTNESAPEGNTQEAAQQRPIPCSVQAHGISEVEKTLRHQPERAPCDDSVHPQTMNLDELIRIVPSQHPASYYILATRLFEAGRREEAVFWFYAGQLRYRIRLACHPELPPGTEPALFASLQEGAGQVINEHAGGDPDAWAAAMERALEWDERTPNGFEPKEPCRAAIADQRGGLATLVDYVRRNKEQIRAERASRGLPNR